MVKLLEASGDCRLRLARIVHEALVVVVRVAGGGVRRAA
jgi:hypothetical protein